MVINQIYSNKWQLYVTKEKKLIDNVRMYEDASEYLTKEAFYYVCSADEKHYKNYVKEVYQRKRREMLISDSKMFNIGKYNERLLNLIHSYSMELMKLEETSFNLVKSGKIENAKALLFSDEYKKMSDDIAYNIDKFENSVSSDIKKELNFLTIVVNITFIGEIAVSVLIIIIGPLRNKIINELLYIDPLTHKKNRIAFERYINSHENKIKGMVFLDANNLKKTNDKLGHIAGDNLLITISECIHSVFNAYGTLFRISGDEFIVILNKDIDEKELLNKFNQKCDEMSKKLGNTISASCGFAIQDIDNSIPTDDLYFIAEQNMYQAKSAYYKETGIDRRNT